MSTENQQKDISYTAENVTFPAPAGGEGTGEASPEAADSGTQKTFETPTRASQAKPGSRTRKAIITVIVLLGLLTLLAVIFRDQIGAFLWKLVDPIGPGCLPNDPLA